jgi:N-acetylneuraminic acid mutarotase
MSFLLVPVHLYGLLAELMKTRFTLSQFTAFLSAVNLILQVEVLDAAPFTPGNVVVYRVGTGTTALTNASTEVFLDEYSRDGSLVQSIALPTSDNGANQSITASGTATSAGLISRSSDGQFIIVTGYDSAPGVASISSSATVTVTRVIGRVAANGTVDSSTTTTSFSGNNIRGATSTDGTGFWASGANTGIIHQALGGSGAGTIVSNTSMNNRSLGIFGGQLYVSSGSGTNTFRGVSAVGTGLPTTTGQTTTRLPGLNDTDNPSSYQFFFADLDAGVAGNDTLYIADDAAGALTKWSLVAGTWTKNNTIGVIEDAYRGLTGTVNGTTVTLFATRDTGLNSDTLVSLVDASGYNANIVATPITIATAATNTALRGVALSPGEIPKPIPTVSISNASIVEGNSGITTLSLVVTRSDTATDFTVDYAVTGGTATSGTDFATLAPGTLTFDAAGPATQNIDIAVIGDVELEADETIILTLSNIVNTTGAAVILDATGTGTITNDDIVPASITTHPSSVTIATGQSTTLNVTVGGFPSPSFQWYVGNSGDTSTPVGTNSSSFTTPTLTTNTSYWVRASNAGGSADSNTAIVTVSQPPPLLTLTLDQASVQEGGSLAGTVSIDKTWPQDIVVALGVTTANRISFPATVTLAAGQLSAPFTIQALQNQALEPAIEVTLIASANGLTAVTANLLVTDDDVPVVQFTLDQSSVSEEAGAVAVRGTVRLDRPASVNLVASFTAAPAGQISLPMTVVIPAGTLTVPVPISIVDNAELDGYRVVTIGSQVSVSGGGVIATPAPVQLTLTDNEGPSLSLSFTRTLLVEGRNPAATGMVTVQPVPTTALVVTLSASDATKVVLPASITIPAGQPAASFTVGAADDGQPSGTQSITFQASAEGYHPAVTALPITDEAKPDLRVELVSPPTGAETDAWLNLKVRLTNQGTVVATRPFTQRFYLSSDDALGGDTVIGQQDFTGSLPADTSLELTLPVRLPGMSGRFWLVVETDANGAVDEVLEGNNATIARTPLDLEPAYRTTLSIAPTTLPTNTPVPITGTATLRGGGPAPFVLVNIHVTNRGIERVISALTNAVGQYSTSFTPLPGEGGLLQFAATHPSVAAGPIQDEVKIYGFIAEPSPILVEVAEGGTATGSLTLRNSTDLPLTGLTVSVTGLPSGVQFTPSLMADSLAGSGTVLINYDVTGQNAAEPQTFRLLVSSAEGAALEVPVTVTVANNAPRLVAEPTELKAGMKRGGQQMVEFTLRNDGLAATAPISIMLPSGAPWMSVATKLPLDVIPAGQTAKITLQLLPPEGLVLTQYEGTIVCSDGVNSVPIPFSFRAVSDSMGQLVVRAEDEYTYYAAGNPPLAGATITLLNKLTGEVVDTIVSDEAGLAEFGSVTEGYYDIIGNAPSHLVSRQTIFVEAGKLNDKPILIPREAVSYTWKVTPTEIADVTRITIESKFETNVPMPVVTVDPPYIDWQQLQFVNGIATVNLTFHNHGLIAAQNVRVTLPEHSGYAYDLPITNIGTLAANSNIGMALKITKLLPLEELLPVEQVSIASILVRDGAAIPSEDNIDTSVAARPPPGFDPTSVLAVQQFEPSVVAAGKMSTLRITGSGFNTFSKPELFLGTEIIAAEWVSVKSSNIIDATFAMPIEARNGWRVRVVDSIRYVDGTDAANATTRLHVISTAESTSVLGMGTSVFTSALIGFTLPPETPPQTLTPIRVLISNPNSFDVPTPLVKASVLAGGRIDLQRDPIIPRASVHLFPVGARRMNILAPGESVEIQLWAWFDQSGPVGLRLERLSDEDAPVDWMRCVSYYREGANLDIANPTPASPVVLRCNQLLGASSHEVLESLRRFMPHAVFAFGGADDIANLADTAVLATLLDSTFVIQDSDPNSALVEYATETAFLSQVVEAVRVSGANIPIPPGLPRRSGTLALNGMNSLMLSAAVTQNTDPCPDDPTPNPDPCAEILPKTVENSLMLASYVTLNREAVLPYVFVIYGQQVAGVFSDYADLNSSVGPYPRKPFARRFFGDQDAVVSSYYAPTQGFAHTEVTQNAARRAMDIAVGELLRQQLPGGQCAPFSGNIEKLLDQAGQNGRLTLDNYSFANARAFSRFALNYACRNDGDSKARFIAGGVGGHYVTEDSAVKFAEDDRRIYGQFSFKPVGRCPKKWDIELKIRNNVIDAFDMCPGSSGTPGTRTIVHYNKILEANGINASVPFVADFSLPERFIAQEKAKLALKLGRLNCPDCCPKAINTVSEYLCGGSVISRAIPVPIVGVPKLGNCVGQPSTAGGIGGGAGPTAGVIYSAPIAVSGTSCSQSLNSATSPLRLVTADAVRLPDTTGTPLVLPAASSQEGICAKVLLKLNQDAVMARDAFQADLSITNATANLITNLAVTLEIKDPAGQVRNGDFGIHAPQLIGLTSISGTGSLLASATGSAGWLIIPTTAAASATAVKYTVSGLLSYMDGANSVAAPLGEVEITVYPQPQLGLKYFHQRDVLSDDPFTLPIEPAIPYSLAVMIQNNGAGVAKNMRITSAQPKIIENEKGLLVDFRILATQVAGQALQPSLTANFGSINPGEIKIGEWLLTSSLQGLFIDYKATFEHVDELNDPRLSLIDSVGIHEMIHQVRALGALEDGKPDFLVNDVPDARDLPDTIHLSDGSVAPVSVVEAAGASGGMTKTLTATLPAGWSYLRIPDPSNGSLRLTRVVRSDGLEVPIDVNVWVTDRTFIGQGQRPVYEPILHLLDHDSTGSYTLTYEALPDVDMQAPTSQVAGLAENSPSVFAVNWQGSDNRGIAFYDLFVSTDGGAFLPWLERTLESGALFEGETGRTYAFNSRATDAAGNREAARSTADATTAVTVVNQSPTLDLIPDQEVAEGNTFVLDMKASDPDGLSDLLRFELLGAVPPGLTLGEQGRQLRWVTGESDGGRVVPVQIRVSDSGVPAQSAQRSFVLRVVEVNGAPVLGTLPLQVTEPGSSFSLQLQGNDPDLPTQTLSYSFGATVPAGMTIDAGTGLIQWSVPMELAGSSHAVEVVVRDDFVPPASSSQTFLLTVEAVGGNAAPVAHASSNRGLVGDLVLGQVTGSDSNDDPLVFEVKTQPGHGVVTMNPDGSYRYRGTPGYEGRDSFTFVAHDGSLDSLPATVTLSITTVVAEWTWMAGADESNQRGSYGQQGLGGPANLPGARSGAASWTDQSGALWLFGGLGHAASNGPGALNDLWKRDPGTALWTWVSGSQALNAPGIYGVRGEATAANTPGARSQAVSWTGSDGRLWLFGGIGRDSSATGSGLLNDLWCFDPVTKQWTWMAGAKLVNEPGRYGSPAVAAEGNVPGSRRGAVGWSDSAGRLWLFGGSGLSATGKASGLLNDLWRYDTTTGHWTFLRGSQSPNAAGAYGALGGSGPESSPGARLDATAWMGQDGTFWLFGGNGRGAAGSGYLNDLWRYHPGTNQWIWMHGSIAVSAASGHGTLGESSPTSQPGARAGAAGWVDASGALWLVGGQSRTGHWNDVWRYDPAISQWTWIKGPKTVNGAASFGTLGVAAPMNTPGARQGGIAMGDGAGDLWLFGGGNGKNTFNDVWRLDLPPVPVVQTVAVSGITTSTATLNAMIQANGLATEGGFRYWQTHVPTVKTEVKAGSVGDTTQWVPLAWKLTDLAPSTRYTVQAFGANVHGEGTGRWIEFVTPGPPSVNSVQVSSTELAVGEGDGTVLVRVILDSPAEAAFSVPFQLSGTAILGDKGDYQVAASTIEFVAGQVSALLAIKLVDDTLAEDEKTIVITFGTPTGSIPLGSKNVCTITIADNDVVPEIVGNPVAQFRPVGTDTFLTVVANGSAPLTYEWQKNGKLIKGAKEAGLKISGTPLSAAGNYRVRVRNPAGISEWSDLAELSVVDASNRIVMFRPNGTATMTVAASSPGALSYQWKRPVDEVEDDPPRIVGANTKTLVIQQLEGLDAGDYVCEITSASSQLAAEGGVNTLAVVALEPQVLPIEALPPGVVGGNYTYRIQVNPDPLRVPKSFSVSGLPSGLSVSSGGVISGRPTSPVVNKPISITAKNTAGNSAPEPCTLTILSLPLTVPGSYVAKVDRHPQVNGNLGGRFDLAATARGSYSAKLMLGGLTMRASGLLAVSLEDDQNPPLIETSGRAVFTRPDKTPLVLDFTLDAPPNTISGAVLDSTNGAITNLSGFRNPWSSKGPKASGYSGYYTFGLDIPVSRVGDLSLPQGTGFGAFTVTDSGGVNVAGRLADGASFSTGTFTGPNGEAVVFVPLTPSNGSIVGIPVISVSNAISGNLSWNKDRAPIGSKVRGYRRGFEPVDLSMFGGFYKQPKAGEVVMGLPNEDLNVRLSFFEGGLLTGQMPPVVFSIRNLTPTGVNQRVAIPTAGGPLNLGNVSFAFAASPHGQFFGGITVPNSLPALVRPVTYQGMIIQFGSSYHAAGYFLLPQLPQPGQSLKTSPELGGKVLLEHSSP